ncbi:MAG: hypothetical protein H6740_28060 [Alphaproteobacteria bacterium]|nr:hypothetical protein [Alphaproteobacteria bacterium]
MRHWIVDRIEGERAILEGPDGAFVERALAELPKGLQEGETLNARMRRTRRRQPSEGEAILARLKASAPEDEGEIEL